ncbi:hypothetical protein [Bacillus thermotolerans]|uniref:hypothetical protein n=1 Tax=Bacillus thermotolerans TaxID=1221996 RepID=UPI0005919856|nr:hypothetical protein [Bacillus thermotolerans]KKB44842.1 hypothetical protein QY96_01123 [Bacillus thermotolerans]
MNKKKAIVALSLAFALLIAGTFVVQQVTGESPKPLDALGRILMGLIPLLLLLAKRIPFSVPLIVSYYLLLTAVFFLGAMLRLYDRLPWWDMALHFFGSAFTAFLAISLYRFFIPKEVEKDLTSWLLFLFVFSLAVAASALWESIEFLGTVMGALEGDSNKDTITDMLWGMAGAFAVSVYAVLRKRRNDEEARYREKG